LEDNKQANCEKNLNLMVNDKVEMVSDYSFCDRVSQCFQVSDGIDLKGNTMLIDSCSTVNLIANKKILYDIHMVKKPLRVQCNTGIRTINLMGILGDFPEPVWYHPQAAANILLLNTVKNTIM